MKREITILVAFLCVLSGCGGNKQAGDGLITVDVTANYPKKELILQDFMDVEYVSLETTAGFITQGKVMDVGKDLLVVTNMRQGDILFFDRATGKGVKKINRRGQGPEEYVLPFNVVLYEDKNEIFVNDGPSCKIQVYDLEGNHKRTISYKPGALVSSLYDYDEDHFLSRNLYAPGNESSANTFFLLSKQDGSMKDIEIPYEKRVSIVMMKQVDRQVFANAPKNDFIVPYQGGWILTEPSADTIYTHQPGKGIRPFMVRTPSVQTMEPEVFLFPGILTDRYYFMQTVKKEYDFEKEEGLPTTDLVYDRQEKKTYRFTVLNTDFSERTENMFSYGMNDDTPFYVTLEASDLVEAYRKGQLKGHLKEIAAGLDEESNPVIMLAKYKD